MILNLDIRGNVTDAVDRKIASVSPARLVLLVRDPLRGFWRDHLKALPSNKKGWPSTGYWEKAADATEAFATSNGANEATLHLRNSHTGLVLRYRGGTIRPVKAGALTIPISPVSYGHRASEFTGLFKITTKNGAYLVQQGNTITSSGEFKQTREKGRGRAKNENRRLKAGLNFLFKLSSGVVQDPNPNVVPTRDQFAEVTMGAIERAMPS